MAFTELTAVFVWWLSLFLLGMLTYPITRKVLRNFGNLSYLFSKIFALLLLTYLTWILSHLFSYSSATIVLALAIMLFCSILAVLNAESRRTFSEFKWSVVEGELIFVSIFAFFLLIRAFRPEIGGLDIGMVGEKWMDLAFLNAVGRSDGFPPIDPWFSSRVIDCYYYFSYLVTSIMIKITSIRVSIAYNLAVATYAALLGSAVFGIAANLCRKKIGGLIAVIFVLFIGNLGVLAPLWMETSRGVSIFHALTTPNVSYFWIPSRVVPSGITEFPFFTFILGDLHPHLVAMPFQMLVLGLLLETYTEKNFIIENKLMLVFLPLSLGFLIPLNSWDYIIYAMLMLGIIAFQVTNYELRITNLRLMMKRLTLSCGLILSSLALYLPFFLAFHPAALEGIELVTGGRTPIYSLVAMFGFFFFLLFSWLLFSIKNPGKERAFFVHLLIFFALVAILIPEVVFLKSGFYSSAIDRGNMIFKFYLQAWLLLGVASAFIFCQVKERMGKKSLRAFFFVLFAVLLIASALYPVLAVNGWTGGFSASARPTLDGLAYMNERKDYKGEYLSIEWLNANVRDAVILEAVEDEEHRTDYCRPGRVSASTGLQTVIGWPWHEFLWRRDEEVWRRVDDVKEIYTTDNVSLTGSLLKKYNVSYVYVGRIERDTYEAEGLVKFESNWFEKVFSKEGVEIYKVKPC
ncbi:MAG: hypothetical protein J7K81_06955 [Methanophagales archaeon]|nr:hypothetical protein [Methanophagales archaeon]